MSNLESENINDESQDLILIVEDDKISSNVLSHIVKNMGFRTLCVEDGYYLTFSCEYFLSVKAIFMDMSMPKMDGYKATRKIRKLFKQRNLIDSIPIIAVTADENKEKCIAAGCDFYLLKPISQECLAESLRAIGLHPVIDK